MQVAATTEEVTPAFEQVVQMFMRDARVKGFRQGKAPRALVERQYAKGIADEVRDYLLPRLYRQAAAEQKISPVSILDVTDVVLDRQTGMSFNIIVDVPPDFELPRYDGIAIKAAEVRVTDEQVQQAFDALLDRMSRFDDVTDGVVQNDHLVQIDYRGQCGAEAITALSPKNAALGEGKDFWMLVSAREFLPGLSEGLLGAATGETRSLRIVFPPDYRAPEIAGREAQYQVTVKRIRARVRPTLDADLLKQLGVETEREVRDRIRQDLITQAERGEHMRKITEIERALLAETTFEVPQSVIADETDHTLRNMVRGIMSEGGSREMIEEHREKIEGQAERVARDRVRLAYILSRIADKEKLEVNDAEVEDRIAQMAASNNMPVEKMRAEVNKRNGMEGVRSDLRANKTMNLLLERAKIKKEG
jgi:trigger factor